MYIVEKQEWKMAFRLHTFALSTQALHHPPSSSLHLQGDSVGLFLLSPSLFSPLELHPKKREKKESTGSTRAQPACWFGEIQMEHVKIYIKKKLFSFHYHTWNHTKDWWEFTENKYKKQANRSTANASSKARPTIASSTSIHFGYQHTL
jgi:hypothetical protein